MIVAEKKKKQGRNEPCACGSGKKYKKCCSGSMNSPEPQKQTIYSLIQEAVTHHKSGNLEAAEAIYHRVLSLQENNADALHLLGEIAYQRKDFRSAVDLIQRAVHINSSSPAVYTNLGISLREMGRYEAAANVFASAIDLDPDFFSSYCNLAVVLNKIRRIDKRGRRYLVQGLVNQIFTIKQKHGILEALGNMPESSREWNQVIFDRCVVPAIAQALEKGDLLSASEINHRTTLTFAQQPHTSEQWRYCHDKTNPMFIAAGQAVRSTLSSLSFHPHAETLPSLGFIIDQSVGTGSGAKVLCSLITGLSLLNPQKLVPIVYAFDQIPEALRQQYLKLGVRVVDTIIKRDPHSPDDDLLQRLKALRQQLQQDQVNTVLYAGTYEAFPCLAASMGLASVQIYLTLGFQSIFISGLDGYIVSGKLRTESHLKSNISEARWRTIPSSLEDPFPVEGSVASLLLKQKVSEVRQAKLPSHNVVLGSIGRPQKMESSRFMDALARIFKVNPNVIFLWFGSTESLSVRQMMEERGISERCLFQGWCDANIYGKLIDIHLDTFPFAMGLSMLETMSAGTASVWMETQKGEAVAVSSDITSLLQGQSGTKEEQDSARKIFSHPETGENLALLAHTEDEYVAHVQHLIDDDSFRSAVGTAGKLFMQRFKHDPRIAAEALSQHALEIIDESRIASCEVSVTEGREKA